VVVAVLRGAASNKRTLPRPPLAGLL